MCFVDQAGSCAMHCAYSLMLTEASLHLLNVCNINLWERFFHFIGASGLFIVPNRTV